MTMTRFVSIFLTARRSAANFVKPWTNTKKASQEVRIANGVPLELSTGSIARFADGSAQVKIGETSVLAVVVWKSSDVGSGASGGFVPLTVSYKQQLASLGRIPMSVDRRDRFDTASDILTGRLIDRSIRPLFSARSSFSAIELTCSVLSDDLVNDPDVVAINAASLSIGLSSLPNCKSVGAVRVASDPTNGFVLNPTRSERLNSDLDLVVSCDVKG